MKILINPIKFSLFLLLPANLFAQPGKLLWKAAFFPPATWSTPAIIQNKIIIQGQDGGMFCYDVNSGNLLWKDSINFGGQMHHPKVANGYIYTTSGISGFCKVDPGDGKIIWNRTDLKYYLTQGTPVGKGNIFLATQLSDLYCLNETNGATRWKKTMQTASLLLHPNGNELIVSEFGHARILGLNVTDGSIKWQITLNDTMGKAGVMALKDSSVLIVCSDMTYTMETQKYYGINLQSKTIMWETDSIGYTADYAPPALFDTVIVISTRKNLGTEPQKLRALSIYSGKQLWSKDNRYGSSGRSIIPVALDAKVFYCNNSDTATKEGWVCANIYTGQKLWVADADSLTHMFSYGGLLVYNNKLYGATHMSGLFCFDAGSINGSWTMYAANAYNTCSAAFNPGTSFKERNTSLQVQGVISPNPSSGHLILYDFERGTKYEIIDMKGTQIISGILNEMNHQMDLSGLFQGIYFIKVSMDGKLSNTYKWVKW